MCKHKPISLIDDILTKADRIKGRWVKGTIKWAADGEGARARQRAGRNGILL